MPEPLTSARPRRDALTRAQVLAVAVRLADDEGVAAVTMRRLGGELGVEAMSLYHHVPGKDALLDGMVEAVLAEVVRRVQHVDVPDSPWPGAVRATVLGAREVVLAHRWVVPLLSSRGTAGEPLLDYVELLTSRMRAAGLTVDLVHHGMHALGSRAVGFSQELLDEEAGASMDPGLIAAMAHRYPTIAAVAALAADHDPASTVGWCDDQAEFEFGLDLVLDGLQRAADPPRHPGSSTA